MKTQASSPEQHHAEVFISHSRKNKDFVGHLKGALEKDGYDVWVDVESITPTADFWPEVYSGIDGADAFVFVISPDSVRSDDCHRELAHAVENNKRLVPIVHREVDEEAVPKPLRAPQWIFFKDGDDFDASFKELVSALDTDLDWLQEHTHLLTRAIEWDRRGRDTSFLLRGSDLRTAEEWQVRAADKEPKLTPLQSEYVLASRRAATRRYWITLGAVTLGLAIAVILGVLAWLARIQAVEQREAAERQANIALGRQLEAQAQLSAEAKPPLLQRSVLLALEARERSPLPTYDADQIVRDALTLLPRPVTRLSHEDNVGAVAFSPDGKYLATTSTDKTVRVWDALNGEEVTRITYDYAANDVAFSPNGKYLAVLVYDVAQGWEAEVREAAGEEVTRITITPKGARPELTYITFSPDGKYLVTTSKNTIQMWDLKSGEEVAHTTLDTAVSNIGDVLGFSPDGKYLVTNVDKTVQVWEPQSGEAVAHMTLDHRFPYITFSPDGKYLATIEGSITSVRGTARVWNILKGQEVAHMTTTTGAGALGPGGRYLAIVAGDSAHVWDTNSEQEIAHITHEDSSRHLITDIAFSQDGKYLTTTSADNTARVWDIASTREFVTMNQEKNVEDVAFSPNGQYLATIDAYGTAHVWEASSGKEVARVAVVVAADSERPGNGIGVLVFSPDSKYLATLGKYGTAHVWEISSGKEVARIAKQDAYDLAFSPDGKYLVTSGGKTIRVGEPQSGEEVARIAHHGFVAFSPDGKYMVTASNKTVKTWDTASGQEIARMMHENDPYEAGSITDAAFSPDGKYLATASDDKTARVWDALNGEEVARMTHDQGVARVTFSPDSKYLVTESELEPMADVASAHLWNVRSGKEVARMTHEGFITALDFSPNGEYLATASDDRTARVWDALNGEEVARMTHEDAVNDVAFSPSGEYLAVASGDGTRRWIWRRPEDLTDEACTRLTRNLTEEEWQMYLDGEPYRKTCPDVMPVANDTSSRGNEGTPKEAPPRDLSPDPAFDRLLGTLQKMTTAPIMLPATLPRQLEKVAITPEDEYLGTHGDKYTILFLTPDAPDDLIQYNTHAIVHGWLTAQPASTPLTDPRRSDYTVTQLGTVTLPNGTIADLKRLDPPEGANYGTQIEGTFEEGGERYTLHIESIDTPDGDLVRKMLSTMVKVPRTESGVPKRFPSEKESSDREALPSFPPDSTTSATPESTTSDPYSQSTEEIETEAQEAAGEYYRAAGLEDWEYTYDHLDSETRSMFTRDEWFQKNQWFADNGSVTYHIESVKRLGTSSGLVAEVSLRLTYEDGSSSTRNTYFVYEDGEWKHAFGEEEIEIFMPDASYEEFVRAQ